MLNIIFPACDGYYVKPTLNSLLHNKQPDLSNNMMEAILSTDNQYELHWRYCDASGKLLPGLIEPIKRIAVTVLL